MELRKLDTAEHVRTRELWESVFSEDTKPFLDYYYRVKARENEIFVAEQGNEIRSMLQMNPYLIQTGSCRFTGHYIVGVATEKAYRRQGLMQSLLIRALHEMYRKKELFTFLMPAAESIYSPYDFRFIYAQQRQELVFSSEEKASAETDAAFSDADAVLGDAEEMALFFERYFAGQYQVYAVRDAAYYQTMFFEQQSEGGGIRLLRHEGRLVGMFFYSREGDPERELEIREPLCLEGFESALRRCVARLCRAEQNQVSVLAAEAGVGRPMIMARVLHPELLFSAMQVSPGKKIDCSLAVVDPLLAKNNRIWRLSGGLDGGTKVSVRETEDSQGLLPIGALTSLLFGYKSIEEISREEGVIMGEELKRELSGLKPLKPIFLNELV